MTKFSTGNDKLRVEGTRAGSSCTVVAIAFKPKSPRALLVDELRAIRNKAITAGMQLKTADEIRSEIEALREFGE